MNPRKFLILIIIFIMALFSLSALADVVILKNGKALKVEKVWQENGQTWIVIDGMRARIPHNKVKRIESNSDKGTRNVDLKKEKSAIAEKLSPKTPNVDLKKEKSAIVEKLSPKTPNVDLKKEKSAIVEKLSPKTPKDTPRIQAKYASPSVVSPKPARIQKDQSQIFPDKKFGDLKWGTRISAINGLEKNKTAKEADGIVEYRRTGENLTLAEIPLKSIQYAFWQDRLYMMILWTQGRSNFTALRDEVFRQFGQGRRAEQFFEKYLWTETPNDIMLEYSKDGQQGMLWLRSSDMDRQYKLFKLNGHASYLKWMKSRN
jgi:hypothetical protein